MTNNQFSSLRKDVDNKVFNKYIVDFFNDVINLKRAFVLLLLHMFYKNKNSLFVWVR